MVMGMTRRGVVSRNNDVQHTLSWRKGKTLSRIFKVSPKKIADPVNSWWFDSAVRELAGVGQCWQWFGSTRWSEPGSW